MAGFVQLSSLITGPTTHLEHDEAGDGSFKDLTGPLPLHMLTYFSTTIRDEYFHHNLKPRLGSCKCSRTWFRNHRQDCHSYVPLPPQTPTIIRLVGGDATSHLDIIHWMSSCCHHNTILPLSSTIASPTRFILAMTSVRTLGVVSLEHEIACLVQKLENEMLDIETVGKVFASGDNVLSEIRDAICTCIAGYFFAGRLQQVDRWMHLSKMNRKFDHGVEKVLERRADGASLAAWARKDVLCLSGPVEQGRPQWGVQSQPPIMPGVYPITVAYADPDHGPHPIVPPSMHPPRPPSRSYLPPEPQHPAAYQHPVRPLVVDDPPVQHISARHNFPGNTTTSSSSNTSDSLVPDPRRVRFVDTPRGPRAGTPHPWMGYPEHQREMPGMRPYDYQHQMPARRNLPYDAYAPALVPFPPPTGSYEHQAALINDHTRNIQWRGPHCPVPGPPDPYPRERPMEYQR